MADTDTDSEETDETAAEDGDTTETDTLIDERVTSPMQSFDSREVTIGFAVLAVGLLVTFLLPLAF